MFNIKENLSKLPETPGVYLHKNELGQVIYVGKAVNLKRRVSSYFQASKNHSEKVRRMVSHISEFEYINCSSEMEALILECNLIKKYAPKYNVLLRDDKTYPYICVTVQEDYPRVFKTRIVSKDGARYFGPYSDASAVNEIVELINKIYRLKRCSSKAFPCGYKPCLNYHIDECRGICTGLVDKTEYREQIDKVLDFLSGKRRKLVDYLTEKMNAAAEGLNFEDAAVYRNQLAAIEAISEKQRVSAVGAKDFDIVLTVGQNEKTSIVLFTVRDGKLQGRETYNFQTMLDEDHGELIGEFLRQYYVEMAVPPHEILVKDMPEDSALIAEYISRNVEYSVKLSTPERGARKALFDLALKDCQDMERVLLEKISAAQEKDEALKSVLRTLTGIEKDVYRVESYDISNTNGIDTVGGMVVFKNRKAVKKDYRRFIIKTVEGQNDYASLEEMLTRRFKRALAGDDSFKEVPDIIMMDGGQGQVSSALKVVAELGFNIPIYGMAKDDKHRTRALVNAVGNEVLLSDYPLLYTYCGTIQEEVHRFAIDYHRSLRNKHAIGSILDNIEGIGPKKRNNLLAHFGSIDGVKNATVEELEQVTGINSQNAKKIHDFFAKN